MNKNITTILTFLLGAAAGSAATWYLLKNKYEQIAQEEIESVKEVYAARYSSEDSESVDEESEDIDNLQETIEEKDAQWDRVEEAAKTLRPKEMPNLMEYAHKLQELHYADETVPYVIAPEQFDENEDYVTESLIYYRDGVLVDEWDNIIENVDDLIGKESLTHFGEYEDDSVHVRNDLLKTDYEILRVEGNYSDVMSNRRTEG